MDELADLAVQASERAEWLGFARFCELRAKGLRADAFKALSGFLDQAETWPFETRLQFIHWLLDKWGNGLDLPQPLYARLVVPTAREWANSKPQEPRAHLWLGLLRCDNPTLHVERALELDPALELARKTLVQWILADIDYNQHEMPSLYIHDPRADLEALHRVEVLIGQVGLGAWVEGPRQEIPDLRRQAQEWIAAHPRKGDFATR